MLSNEEFRAVFDASPDGMLIVGEDGRILAANRQCRALFGYEPAELEGQEIELLVPEAEREAHTRHRGQYVRHPHPRPMGVGLNLQGRRKDGTTFPAEISLSPLRTDGGLRVICAVRDVTLQKRLQSFSEAALRATEEERQRIARELHDDTAQRLATTILRLRLVAEARDPAQRRRVLQEIRDELVATAEGIKRLARGLRPPELEDAGLSAALLAHFRNVEEGTGFRVQAHLEPVDGYLDLTEKLALYRIVQEALSNARRHAGIEEAKVRVFREDGYVVAEVRDDGRGFVSVGLAGDGRGLGLVGMHERAAMIGAGLSVDSHPGEGTVVRVAIPIEGDDEG